MTVLRMRRLQGIGNVTLPLSISSRLTPLSAKAAEGIMSASATQAGQYNLAKDPRQKLAEEAMIATGGRSPIGETDLTEVDTSTPCGCAVAAMAQTVLSQTGVTASNADMLGMVATCENAGYAEFTAAIDQNSPGAFDFSACVPWYKKPKNWVIGAAVIGAGGLLAWSMR